MITESEHSVLVIDDDAAIREMISDYLKLQGYGILEAENAAAARTLLAQQKPSVVLLDISMPGEDGLSLARYIREHLDIGIIIISAAGEAVDRIVGLEIGADDYLAKPFDPRELLARVRSVARRYEKLPVTTPNTGAEPSQRVRVGRCTLDLLSQQLFGPGDEELALTQMEFELLQILIDRPNRVLSRDQILNLTQNRDWDPNDRSIDIRIARLRRKIESDPERPRCIRTVRGSGYMFIPTTE
ncbi:response regulator [Marinobacterium rhizophilum]|uniref:response regulator n=1 Tax=Marinobacterium rhizophilum TaxID=420402 RepID=UPI000378EB52|nr:response regulator [Marinobacterium rhizophilum]